VLEKMQDRLVWVKIQFPAHFTAEVLEELHAGINIVPVENKTLHEQTTTLEETFRVIPLRTGSYESLLSVHSVKDSDGKNYHELLYPAKDSTESYGTYSIRKGGCERFDSRSAKELLGYLSDLLDDETHAFNAVSSIKLQALTIQMEQLMAQMKQTADNMNEFRETPYYLMIDELSGKGQITVKYWTTNCEVGNRIQAGVNLSP
ncbi:flagellar protein FlgN, partial [Bacteroides sp. AM28-6]